MKHRPLHSGERGWTGVRFAQISAAKRDRAHRETYLPSELFAEPAWEILLEVYSFEILSCAVTQSEILARIGVPVTTSLRWMKMLEAKDLVARMPMSEESTEVLVTLTPAGVKAMDGYFSRLEENFRAWTLL